MSRRNGTSPPVYPSPAPALVRVQRTRTHQSHSLHNFRDDARHGDAAALESVGLSFPSFGGLFGGTPLKTQAAEAKAKVEASEVARKCKTYVRAKDALDKTVIKFASGESYNSAAMTKAWTAFENAGTAIMDTGSTSDLSNNDTCDTAMGEDDDDNNLEGAAKMKRHRSIKVNHAQCKVDVEIIDDEMGKLNDIRAAVATDRAAVANNIRSAVADHKANLDTIYKNTLTN